MSVLIKGMEMPKNCCECSLSDVDDDYGRCCLFIGIACLNIGRQDNCPLVSVPTPHGRLIDAVTLEEILTAAIITMETVVKFLRIEDDPEIKMEIKAYTDILNGVKEQLTIIEAEGSET